METIAERYQQVCERIARAARESGREPESVHLVTVTKSHPLEEVQAAIAAGARVLGENYVEEAVSKRQALADVPASWHLIGHVQSRKAEAVSTHFDYLHSLDSLKLARRLDRFAAEQGRVLPVLLECNVSAEESKFGLPAWEESAWERLLPEIEAIAGLTNLRVRGLMTMAPYSPEPEAARPIFRHLRKLQAFLGNHCPQGCWDELSMGMSGDFEVAIQEGATWVRIGEAILGPRTLSV